MNGQNKQMLREMVVRAHTQPETVNLLRLSKAFEQSGRPVPAVVQRLSRLYSLKQMYDDMLHSDPFLMNQPVGGEVDGLFPIGIASATGASLGIGKEMLAGVDISGQSGSGKTHLLKNIISTFINNGIHCFVISYKREYRDLDKKHRDIVDLYRWNV